jgi:isopentenyl diphosphate isomerase/L-lactate dehydrogenase-like FMN-dependent dehydrogenase
VTHYGDYQTEIYLNGTLGQRPRFPLTYPDLEAAAEAALTPEAFGYVAGSAGLERTAAANVAAFERWQIVPRHLRGVAERDLAVEVCGTAMPAPVLLAPVGVLGIVHPSAELAVASAAAGLGLTQVLSTVSSFAMEEVATAVSDGGTGWFQLYWPADRDVAASFVHRAEAAGFKALVVTLDTWQLAWRPRDLAQAYLPFLSALGVGNYFSDPAFLAGLDKPPAEDQTTAIMRWLGMFGDASLTWDDLAWLRSTTSLPIILKGVCHPDDARAALDAGVDGIIVSNHGGRQVDGDLPVIFDSGIRSGADVVKALALGARAAMVGRPYVWGLAVGGEEGVRHVLRSLLAEVDLTMALAGHATPATLEPSILVRASD